MADWKSDRNLLKQEGRVEHQYDIRHRSKKGVFFSIGVVVAIVSFFLIFG